MAQHGTKEGAAAALLGAIGFWRVPGLMEMRVIGEPFFIRTLHVSDPSNLSRLCNHFNSQCMNVYFGVAPRVLTVQRASGRDALRASVVCHVDCDGCGQEALDRLHARNVPPSVVVSSGGGLHLYFKLAEPTDDYERVELCNAKLAEACGGDKCWDASRILRLPGTTNWPDARKRARGRTPAPVETVLRGDAQYRLPELEEAIRDVQVDITTLAPPVDLPDTLRDAPDERILRLLIGHVWPKPKFDRSGTDWNVAVNAYLRGGSDDEVARLLWHAPWGKARETGSRYLRRTLARAKHWVGETRALLSA